MTEIGMNAQKLSWKARVLIGISSGILFGICMYLINTFLFDTLESLSYYLIQAVLFGLLFSSLLPWLSKKLQNKTKDKLDSLTSSLLNTGETIEYSGPANLFKGLIAQGGKLYVSNQKIIFAPFNLASQKNLTQISFDVISKIEPRKTAKLVDNGIRISVSSSEFFDFVVNERDTWLKVLRNKIGS